MKNSIYTLIAFVLLLFISCEKTLIDNSLIDIKDDGEIPSKIVLNTLKIDDLEDISIKINDKYGKSILSNKDFNDNRGELILNEQIVKKLIDTLGNTSYSIGFSFSKEPKEIYYNLIVGENKDGNIKKPYILKFISDKENYENFTKHSNDFTYFKGTINVHKFSDYFNNKELSNKDYCQTSFDEFGDPIACDIITIDSDSTSGGSESTISDPSTSTSNSSNSSLFTTTSISVFHTTPDGVTYQFYEKSTCHHVGECIITVVITPSFSTKTEKNSMTAIGNVCNDCNTSLSGIINTETTSRIDYIVENMASSLSLTEVQKTFLKDESNVYFTESLYDLYLNDKSKEGFKALNVLVDSSFLNTSYYDVNGVFANILSKHTAINSANIPGIEIWFMMRTAELKSLHPEWSELKIFYEAVKDSLHITLDVIGFVPGVGEIADLVNGGVYFAEGDSLNGTLSLSSAIPFSGWTATSSKWAIQVTKLTNGSKAALKMTVRETDGMIDFGVKSSDLFRSQLGLVPKDGKVGHHIIPWNKNEHPLVQAAAKYKWHQHNASLNGIGIPSGIHIGSHNNYDTEIFKKLEFIIDNNPGILNNPELAYKKLILLSDEIKTNILNNINVKINDLY